VPGEPPATATDSAERARDIGSRKPALRFMTVVLIAAIPAP
jgi:hypothetical protein